MKKQNYILAVLLLCLFSLSLIPRAGLTRSTDRTRHVSVTVEKIIQKPESKTDSGIAKVKLRIGSGPHEGDTVLHEQHLWGHSLYDPKLSVGSTFIATYSQAKDGSMKKFQLDQKRTDSKILLLFGITTLLLFAVGRWEGLAGLFSTLVTLVLILYFFFPVALTSDYVLLLGFAICAATVIVTVVLVMQFKPLCLPTCISLLIGLTLSFGATIFGLNYLRLNPLKARHSRLVATHLNNLEGVGPDNLRMLIASGIVLGTLGAMMDVGVVITSTVHEIVRDKSNISWHETFMSGMKVGREILSTMVNTLSFAYLGVLFPIAIALVGFDIPILRFLNFSFVGIEILRLSIGLLGLSLIIPISAFLGTAWCHR